MTRHDDDDDDDKLPTGVVFLLYYVFHRVHRIPGLLFCVMFYLSRFMIREWGEDDIIEYTLNYDVKMDPLPLNHTSTTSNFTKPSRDCACRV